MLHKIGKLVLVAALLLFLIGSFGHAQKAKAQCGDCPMYPPSGQPWQVYPNPDHDWQGLNVWPNTGQPVYRGYAGQWDGMNFMGYQPNPMWVDRYYPQSGWAQVSPPMPDYGYQSQFVRPGYGYNDDWYFRHGYGPRY